MLPVLRIALLAALLPGLLASQAAAARERRDSGDGGGHWRAVRLCQSESCWTKHPDGWGPAGRGRSRR